MDRDDVGPLQQFLESDERWPVRVGLQVGVVDYDFGADDVEQGTQPASDPTVTEQTNGEQAEPADGPDPSIPHRPSATILSAVGEAPQRRQKESEAHGHLLHRVVGDVGDHDVVAPGCLEVDVVDANPYRAMIRQ